MEKMTLWSVKASSGSAALLTPDQGHSIMGCPAATLLSTGLTDEGERSELWWQESGLRGLDKDQPLSGEKTAKKRGTGKKTMIRHLAPSAFKVLTNRCALLLASVSPSALHADRSWGKSARDPVQQSPRWNRRLLIVPRLSNGDLTRFSQSKTNKTINCSLCLLSSLWWDRNVWLNPQTHLCKQIQHSSNLTGVKCHNRSLKCYKLSQEHGSVFCCSDVLLRGHQDNQGFPACVALRQYV